MLIAKLTVCYHIMGHECVINTITWNFENSLQPLPTGPLPLVEDGLEKRNLDQTK